MPVEIRELIIKTQITQNAQTQTLGLSESDLQKLKQEILADCLRYLKQHTQNTPASPFER